MMMAWRIRFEIRKISVKTYFIFFMSKIYHDEVKIKNFFKEIKSVKWLTNIRAF